jgi:hypothetical protein
VYLTSPQKQVLLKYSNPLQKQATTRRTSQQTPALIMACMDVANTSGRTLPPLKLPRKIAAAATSVAMQ